RRRRPADQQRTVNRRRGPLRNATNRARARDHATKRRQASVIRQHRHLRGTRPENVTGPDRRHLSRMFAASSALRRLRAFVLLVYGIFKPALTFRQAAARWANLVTTSAFLADPDLARAIAMMTPAKVGKMIAY